MQLKKPIKSVIHFAGLKSVSESVKNPIKYYNNNLISLLNILKSMKENNVSKIVFSSSCTVYGQPDILPVSEDAPFKISTDCNELKSTYSALPIVYELLKSYLEGNLIESLCIRILFPDIPLIDIFPWP